MLQHCTLPFVGKMDPYGPMPPTFELQARVVTRVLSGRLPLPSRDQMMTTKDELSDGAQTLQGLVPQYDEEMLVCL